MAADARFMLQWGRLEGLLAGQDALALATWPKVFAGEGFGSLCTCKIPPSDQARPAVICARGFSRSLPLQGDGALETSAAG